MKSKAPIIKFDSRVHDLFEFKSNSYYFLRFTSRAYCYQVFKSEALISYNWNYGVCYLNLELLESRDTPQRRPHYELSWMSWANSGFFERPASGDWFCRDSSRADGKQQPAWCSRKTQDQFAMASMPKKLLYRCIGAHARVHVHFLRRVSCIYRCCWAPCMCRCVR